MTYVVALPCVDLKDRACFDENPVDCIYEGKRVMYIDPEESVDCGACEPVWPVEAISYEDDRIVGAIDFLAVNTQFFTDLGSPGGATATGPIDHDHPQIAELRTVLSA